MTIDDDDLDNLLEQARIVSPERQPRHAEMINRKVIERRPHDSASYLRLARALQAQFRFSEGQQACNEAVGLATREADAVADDSLTWDGLTPGERDLSTLMELARSVSPEGQPILAERVNLSLIAQRPNDSPSYLRLARALQVQSRFGAARGACERAVQLKPASGAARNRLRILQEAFSIHMQECSDLAAALVEQRKFEATASALSTYQDALHAAMKLRESGPIALRFTCLWRAADLAEDEAQGVTALVSLAATYRDLDHPDALHRSEDMYRDILKRQTSNAAALTGLGGVLRSLGKLEEARATYERVLKRDESDAAALVGLGAVLHDMGQLVQGLWRVRKFVESEKSLQASARSQTKRSICPSGTGLDSESTG